jgi:hypothetical protein
VPFVEPALDLRAQRPVAIAAVGGELEEVVLLDPALELLRAEEVVVDPVRLPLARLLWLLLVIIAWIRSKVRRSM